MNKLRFLLLEDSMLDAELVGITLVEGGIDFEWVIVQTRADFVDALASAPFDVILSDYSLPDFDGISALEIARDRCPDVPFIFVSAALGEELAIETLKSGATDYVLKQRLERLVPAVQRALREARERRERQHAEHALREYSERLKLLFEMTRDLLSTEQPLTLLIDLFAKLSDHMELHFYFNFLVDPANPRLLRLASYSGISEGEARLIETIEFGQSTCGFVAQERCQLVINDLQHSTHPNCDYIRSLGVTAYAGQPLIVRGQLLGTLSFASRTRTHFTPEETALLQTTSDQVAIAIDRTELITSLQQQTDQLARANRIKDEFLAVLSHELRTPLNPILGWSKLLQTQNYDDATVIRALTTIERNARIQIQLIDDLLDVSRILRGKLNLDIQPVDLSQTIEAALETVRLAADAKLIQLHANIAPNVGHVFGDPGRLHQVVWNLLSNAIKFTPQGGQIEVHLKRIDDQAQISVTDTGKGISPDFLPYVFDYFRQAEGGTTRRFGGLGLGLAIVRHLVELHGGTVGADSPGEGEGSTFTVTLPLIKTNLDTPEHYAKRHTSSSPPRFLLQGVRILAVDDQADMRDYIALALKQAGATVTVVASAQEVLDYLDHALPDLLLADIAMPEMDGYRLLHHIRLRPPEQGGLIPAIALTAYAGESDRQQALAAGFHIHLPKPIDPDTLISTIATLVKTH